MRRGRNITASPSCVLEPSGGGGREGRKRGIVGGGSGSVDGGAGGCEVVGAGEVGGAVAIEL